MSGIISRDNILKEKTKNVEEGKLVLKLFELAEELGICSELELENNLSFPAMDYAVNKTGGNINPDWVYNAVRNVYYVVELYLRGYIKGEQYIGYEEFINLIKNQKANEVIQSAHDAFKHHISRLKSVIAKSKKKIPWNNKAFSKTRELLQELDSDLSICDRFPSTSARLEDFYFGRDYGQNGPVTVQKWVGFISLEKTVYTLYNELCILTKFDEENILNVTNLYIRSVGHGVPYNLFEKVINNYLFAQIYSDNPENLVISKVDADLLIREIGMGTLNSDELISQLINKYQFDGHNAEYLKNYGTYIQKRIEALRNASYFGELFVVTPPD